MLDIHDITDICGVHDLHDVHDVFDSYCIQHGYALYEIYDQHDPARIRRQARAAREQGADAILQACRIILSALSIRYRRCIQYTRRHIRSAISTIQTRYTIYVRYQRSIRWQCLQLSHHDISAVVTPYLSSSGRPSPSSLCTLSLIHI